VISAPALSCVWMCDVEIASSRVSNDLHITLIVVQPFDWALLGPGDNSKALYQYQRVSACCAH
jgi:hypothetical protein